MKNHINEINIPLDFIEPKLSLNIYGNKLDSLFLIDNEIAIEYGMSQFQILEGNYYNYYFNLSGSPTNKYQLKENVVVKNALRLDASEGRISPNIYVGSLPLTVYNKLSGVEYSAAELEVLATKLDENNILQEDTNYQKNYQFMLQDIAEKCTELLMQIESPITQNFEIDFNKENETVYQRFAFVSSIINTNEFNEAIHRIIASPTTKWNEAIELKDIRALRRLDSFSIRQIASRGNRIKLNAPIGKLLDIPSKFEAPYKTETIDTPENRFIKHALEVFLKFCIDCRTSFKINGYSKSIIEVEVLIGKIENHLNQPFFKDIERPTTLKLNSPALQRKSGYRELLNAWLQFDLAAKLVWKGGDDVYKAGKRDIAILYEYWLFFVLYDLMKSKFRLDNINGSGDYGHLIEWTKDGLNIMIKSGKMTALEGIYNSEGRDLHFKFSYNRTFYGGTKYGAKKAGSWTKALRPDYTLSIWPEEIKEETKAEELEKIVHIHFDAKYKVQQFTIKTDVEIENLGLEEDSTLLLNNDKMDSLEKEKLEERKGVYKNADLLKMHAYKDAIRRTGGAYVLYPGSAEHKEYLGFHELIPGLGAFSIRPKRGENGTIELGNFIDKIINHFNNMASQQRRHSNSIYEIFKNDSPRIVNEPLPDYIIPDETHVIVAYYKSKEHLKWILNEMKYNGRIYGVNGSMDLTPEFIGAKYLLLHNKDERDSIIYKIDQTKGKQPTILTSSHHCFNSYPSPSKPFYLVFNLLEKEKQFLNRSYKFKLLDGYSEDKDAYPFTCKLSDLISLD